MAIKTIRMTKGVGVLADVIAKEPKREFLTNNLMYGFNGSGKSTLSRLFSCLQGNHPIETAFISPSGLLNRRRYCRRERRRLPGCLGMAQEGLMGVERRRRWSDGQKLSMLREVSLNSTTPP